MKICNKCSEENEDAANFCKRCSASFEAAGKATCPRGHIIDPTWAACPYCRAEDSSPDMGATVGGAPRRKETVVETGGQPMSPPLMPPPLPMPGPPSLSGSPQPMQASGGRRKTVFIPPPEQQAEEGGTKQWQGPGQPPPPPPRRMPDRRVVGVLVTYSWKPEGQVFAVREGRNLIGRGDECDICVQEDSTLSNVNTHITYRKNFVVGDMVSMSGTDVNGHPIEEQFVPLTNYATIRTGSTNWTFIVIDPSAASTSSTPE